MKIETYAVRKEIRDLFDIVFILKSKGGDYDYLKEIIAKYGMPANEKGIKNYILREEDYEFFKSVVKDAT